MRQCMACRLALGARMECHASMRRWHRLRCLLLRLSRLLRLHFDPLTMRARRGFGEVQEEVLKAGWVCAGATRASLRCPLRVLEVCLYGVSLGIRDRVLCRSRAHSWTS